MKKTILFLLIFFIAKSISAQTINQGPSNDYLGYLAAVEEGDWNKIKEYIYVDKSLFKDAQEIEDIDIHIAYYEAIGGVREGYREELRRGLLEEMGGKPDISLFVASVQGNTPQRIKIVDEEMEGDKARLIVTGWRVFGGESRGTISLIRDGDSWKIFKEAWEPIADAQREVNLNSLSNIARIEFAFVADGGTITIEIEDIEGEIFLLSLDRQINTTTRDCFYVGAPHPTEPNARMLEVAGEEEMALARALDVWLKKNVGGAQEIESREIKQNLSLSEFKAQTVIELLKVLNNSNRPSQNTIQ